MVTEERESLTVHIEARREEAPPDDIGEPVFRLDGVTVAYDGRRAVRDITLDIPAMIEHTKQHATIDGFPGGEPIDNAKLFVDWVLSKEAQELAWKQGKSYQILTNTTADTSPNSLKLDDLKLINYDMDKYGSTEVRKALINKWVSEVKMGK